MHAALDKTAEADRGVMPAVTLYQRPNCCLAKQDMGKGSLRLQLLSTRYCLDPKHAKPNDVWAGAFTDLGDLTPVWLQPMIQLPDTTKGTDEFICPGWFVESLPAKPKGDKNSMVKDKRINMELVWEPDGEVMVPWLVNSRAVKAGERLYREEGVKECGQMPPAAMKAVKAASDSRRSKKAKTE